MPAFFFARRDIYWKDEEILFHFILILSDVTCSFPLGS